MEATHTIEERRQRLIEKAARRNKKSKRLQKKIQREIEKKNPNMIKVSKWQDKSAKHVDKGLRYMDQMKTLGQNKNDQKTEISFNLEKVCLCEFSSQYRKDLSGNSDQVHVCLGLLCKNQRRLLEILS